MELILFVGLPGSGKTSFYEKYFQTTHAHISKDRFPRSLNKAKRQRALLDFYLSAKKSVVVDNVNATLAQRAEVIEQTRNYDARIIGYWFQADVAESIARNEKRLGKSKVPKVAIYTAAKKLQPPSYSEGFQELYRVTLKDRFEVTPLPR
jgi:predicted kinase